MATVVESEEVKTDEEKAVKKVVEEENEPESAGGCDVCLPPIRAIDATPARRRGVLPVDPQHPNRSLICARTGPCLSRG